MLVISWYWIIITMRLLMILSLLVLLLVLLVTSWWLCVQSSQILKYRQRPGTVKLQWSCSAPLSLLPSKCLSGCSEGCWVLVLLSQCGDGSGTQPLTHGAGLHLGSLYTLVIADAMRLCCLGSSLVELLHLRRAQSRVPPWRCSRDVGSWLGNIDIRTYFLSFCCCDALKLWLSLKCGSDEFECFGSFALNCEDPVCSVIIAELAMKTYEMYFEQRRRGFDSGTESCFVWRGTRCWWGGWCAVQPCCCLNLYWTICSVAKLHLKALGKDEPLY